MSQTPAGQHGGPERYEIRLKGHLDSPVGRLVRRAEPYQRERRHHPHPWPGGRPGRAARLAAENTRPGPAPDLGHLRRTRPSPGTRRRDPITQQFHEKGDRHGHHRPNPSSETNGEKSPDDLDEEDRARRGHLLPDHLHLDPHTRPLRPHQKPPGLDPRLRRPHRRAGGRLPRGDRRPGRHRHRRHAVPGGQAAERKPPRWASPPPASWKPP